MSDVLFYITHKKYVVAVLSDEGGILRGIQVFPKKGIKWHCETSVVQEAYQKGIIDFTKIYEKTD